MSEPEDKRRDAAPDDGDTAESTSPRWAADEPTAMWDDGALRDQGYAGVADAPAVAPTTPATGPDVGGAERANVVSQSGPAPLAPPPARAGGMSWPMTIAIATAVAVIVYFLVRALR